MIESMEETELKEVGWYNIIDNAMEFDHSIEPFGDLANHWECCAIGEICGWPDDVYSHRLPEDIRELGDNFGLAVRHDKVKEASQILQKIIERKEEILKIDDLWD